MTREADIEAMARAIFRASFSPDEDETTVEECWQRWGGEEQSRYRRFAQAAYAIVSKRIEELEEALRKLIDVADATAWAANTGQMDDCILEARSTLSDKGTASDVG